MLEVLFVRDLGANIFSVGALTEKGDRTEYALVTGDAIGDIGTRRPGEVCYMPADPPTYDDAASGPDAEGWIAGMRDERQTLIDHDVCEGVDPPDDAQLLPSRFHHKLDVQPGRCNVSPK